MATIKEMSMEVMQQKMEELMRENAELKKHRSYDRFEVNFRINERGGIAIYGLSKYPVNLFAEQIYKILDKQEALKDFIDENKDNLSWRNNSRTQSGVLADE